MKSKNSAVSQTSPFTGGVPTCSPSLWDIPGAVRLRKSTTRAGGGSVSSGGEGQGVVSPELTVPRLKYGCVPARSVDGRGGWTGSDSCLGAIGCSRKAADGWNAMGITLWLVGR